MMRWLFYVGFVALLGFDTLGQIAFKLTAMATEPVEPSLAFVGRLLQEPWAWGIAVAYGGAFLTYVMLMRSTAIGPLFAASHLEILTVAAASFYLFGERLAPIQIVGCLTILAGAVVLAHAEGKAGAHG